jgi:hypothetical protein
VIWFSIRPEDAVPEVAVPEVPDIGTVLPSLIGAVHDQLPTVIREIAQQELRDEVMLLRHGHGDPQLYPVHRTPRPASARRKPDCRLTALMAAEEYANVL